MEIMVHDFYSEYVNHVEQGEEVQKALLAAIDENTRKVTEHYEANKELLAAWQAGKGTIKVVTWIGKMVLWISSVAVAATAFIYAIRNGFTPPK
jgi:hypothetical protein